jgi:hypothetical protein
MEHKISYHDEVWSADDKKLGVATAIHHRPDGSDPELKFYEAYLEVEDFSLGMSYYIPTEFITDRDDETGQVTVDETQKAVLDNTWARRPRFVAIGAGRREELPGKSAT